MNAPKESAAPRRRPTVYRLELPAKLEATEALADFVDACAQAQGWDGGVAMKIGLVLEELAVNAIAYGFADGREGHLRIVLEAEPEAVDIAIEDDGDPFDPFSIDAPDVAEALESRPVGGLGVHFVRSFMDAWSYARRDGHNRISLSKRLTAARDA